MKIYFWIIENYLHSISSNCTLCLLQRLKINRHFLRRATTFNVVLEFELPNLNHFAFYCVIYKNCACMNQTYVNRVE